MADTISNVEISSPDTNGATGPLAFLESSTNKLNPLRYPSDLATDPSKSHYVNFLIKRIQPSKTATGITSAGDVLPAVKSVGQELVRNLLSAYYYPNTTDIVDVISLYMPDTLSSNYNASYDELSLTNDLGKGVMAIQGINSIADYIGNKNAGAGRSVDAIAAAAIGAGLGTAASAVGASGSGIADVFIQSQGFAINPQLQMIYRGLDFRQFQLSFTFTPASKQEADDTNKIIASFKYHFSPDLVKIANATNGMFFIPPSIFNVQFMFGPKENLYLPRYGDCVLKDIDVNYAPNGFAAHNDGSPIQTQLTLTFQEIEIVTKEKIRTGYYATTGDQLGSSVNKTAGLR
jgi:hypothetical protein